MIGRSVFGTPLNYRLLLAARPPKQCPIAATHQRQPALDQADRAVTQVMGFPGMIRNAVFAKQGFCNGAIAVSFGSAIEGADGKRYPLASLRRQRRK